MKHGKLLILALVLIDGAIACQTAPAAPEDFYQLNGTITQSDGKPLRNETPIIFLHSATLPFTTQVLAFPAGKFRIKKLLPGIYTLVVFLPHAGEMHKTIEVGPSFADTKKRINTSIPFERNAKPNHSISTVELSIPLGARSAYEKAQDYLSKHEVGEAVAALQKAVRLAPQFWMAWNNLGTIAYQTGHFSEAEGHFREALKYAPGAQAPLVNLGGALLSEGKVSDALPINRQAVDSKPDDPLAHSQLGQTYLHLGLYQDAEEHLKQAKALDPRHFSYPQLPLSQIYEQRGDYHAMALELEEFLKLHPDSSKAEMVRQKLASVRSSR